MLGRYPSKIQEVIANGRSHRRLGWNWWVADGGDGSVRKRFVRYWIALRATNRALHERRRRGVTVEVSFANSANFMVVAASGPFTIWRMRRSGSIHYMEYG